MSVKTRIELGSFGPGSVELPEKITLSCPKCGTLVADKGQCRASLSQIPDESSKTGLVVKLVVDCRNCGCIDKAPACEI